MNPSPESNPIEARPISRDWSILPAWLPMPGMGTLAVNSFLLKGEEPMLVDTGLQAMSDAMLGAIAAEIDLGDLRWIWLSHTDADHIGNLDRILELAPKAEVVTDFLGAGKMGMLGKGDPSRFHLLQGGDALTVGRRRLVPIKPPYYDAPETMGFYDPADRVLFVADAFGALLPAAEATAEAIAPDSLREGIVSWSAIDAPWLAQIDSNALGATLQRLEALDPAHILSGHLPPARDLKALSGIVRGCSGFGARMGTRSAHAGHAEATTG